MHQIDDWLRNELTHATHSVLSWQAEDCNLLDQLAAFSLTREQWLESQELSKYAADGPNIDRRAVVRAAEDELGRAVIAAHDVGSVFALAHQFSRAEVADFDDLFSSHKNVLRLQVAVNDTLTVHILHALEDLVHVLANLTHLEVVFFWGWLGPIRFDLASLQFSCLDDFLEVSVTVFEDKILCGFTVLAA